MSAPAMAAALSDVFHACPASARKKLLAIRDLIFDTADEVDAAPLTEALKWGQPAYLTEKTKSGSTIRLGWHHDTPDHITIYFICHTNLVETFRTLYPGDFEFEGNRALTLRISEDPPAKALSHCIAMALTYHRSKS